jgi:hypothetical protein
MTTAQRTLAGLAATLATVAGTALFLKQDPPASLTERIGRLEARVAKLESVCGVPAPAPAPAPVAAPATPRSLVVPVTVSNKKYTAAAQAGGQDNIWFDARYDFKKLPRKARAIKGTLVFEDLFGQVMLRVNSTVTEEVGPGGEVRERGIGFVFDKKNDAHRWMRDTEIKDMKVSFKVDQILWADGSRDQLQ